MKKRFLASLFVFLVLPFVALAQAPTITVEPDSPQPGSPGRIQQYYEFYNIVLNAGSSTVSSFAIYAGIPVVDGHLIQLYDNFALCGGLSHALIFDYAGRDWLYLAGTCSPPLTDTVELGSVVAVGLDDNVDEFTGLLSFSPSSGASYAVYKAGGTGGDLTTFFDGLPLINTCGDCQCDCNIDSTVGGPDGLIQSMHWGQTVGPAYCSQASRSLGDCTCDGVVGGPDRLKWGQEFGQVGCCLSYP